uniref:Secreted protein n=1 Tax=Parascaris univalens TaxID=6257 RepID=A0A915A1A9_PARUN
MHAFLMSSTMAYLLWHRLLVGLFFTSMQCALFMEPSIITLHQKFTSEILLFFFIVATGPCIQRVSNEVCFQLVSLSPASSALCP